MNVPSLLVESNELPSNSRPPECEIAIARALLSVLEEVLARRDVHAAAAIAEQLAAQLRTLEGGVP
jgi:hypothetical protein